MSIRFNGINLLMDGKVGDGPDSANIRNWVRDTIPMKQHFASPKGPTVGAWATVAQREYFDVTPELNTLYWPTGATRWATGWFMGTSSMASSCISASWSGGNPAEGTLSLGDLDEGEPGYDENERIDAAMYLLPPVPLAWVTDSEQLYLLPFVDDRYFWRWKHLPQESVNMRFTEDNTRLEIPEWKNLYEECRKILGQNKLRSSLETGDSPALHIFDIGEYPEHCEVDALRTDDPELTRNRTLAEILELIAVNTGRVVVRDFDGVTRLLTWPDSEIRHTANANKSLNRVAGLDAFSSNAFQEQVSGMYPEKLVMAFPARHGISGRVKDDGWYTREEKLGGVAGTEMHITNSIMGLYIGSNLTNKNILDKIVEQVSKDIKLAAGKYLDFVLAGIGKYDPTGWSDVIEFRCHHDQCSTRVRSRPWNWHSDKMNHGGLFDPRPLGIIFEAELVNDMERGGTALADIKRSSGGTSNLNAFWSPTGDEIDIYDADSKIPQGTVLNPGNSVTVYSDEGGVNRGLDEPGKPARTTVYILLSFDCNEVTLS